MSSKNTVGRVVIEDVRPEVDAGRFPAKRVLGDPVTVEADVFTDGHERVAAALLYRHEDNREWTRVALAPLVNDRWSARFVPTRLGRHLFTIVGWRDEFATWAADLEKRIAAGTATDVDLAIGAALVEQAAGRAEGDDVRFLTQRAQVLRAGGPAALAAAQDPVLAGRMDAHPDLQHATRFERELPLWVDRERAAFSAWYEMFPRSCATEPGRHGTLRDALARLPYVAEMGFDVVYLPPIHPIGRAHRKGRNNALVAGPEDPGSPWAIGGREGGHKSLHPELGTFEDFDAFVRGAGALGIEVALDLAYQCSPDHPCVREHPEWFRPRPDGTIQYAENPPKKYQDIYPFEFDGPHAAALWDELLSIVLFWMDRGVRIFRVDNPHTKPFRLWEWLIAEARGKDAGVIFLAEAFTRPKVMYHLAKLGFTQSYTYFTWRRSAAELREYATELGKAPVCDFFRPNFWPNTPDILSDVLQNGGRAASATRLVLAATLAGNYGLYGPAFELAEVQPREPGSEEYLSSEKYEIRTWDLDRPDSLRPLLQRVNAIRRTQRALQRDGGTRFHPADNAQLLCYSRHADGAEPVLVVVNLDPYWKQGGWLQLDLAALGLGPDATFQVHDLLTDERFWWHGSRNYVELDPHTRAGHVFVIDKRS